MITKNKVKTIVTGFLWCIFAFGVQGQNLSTTLLASEVTKLKSDPVMQYGQLGLSIQSMKTGKTVFEENALKNMVPASNLKLLTTAAALGILGDQYTFQTVLEYDGVLKDGILDGNLYIRGSGDPSLGSDRYKGYLTWEALIALWAVKVKEAGIRKINGAVVADASYFGMNPIPDNWPWGDIGNYYGAGVYGLNLNENMYRLYFRSGANVGDSAALVRTVPRMLPGTNFVNEVKTGAAGSGDKAYVYAAPRSPWLYASGTIPAGKDLFSIRGAIPDPPALCASLLTEALAGQKVAVAKKPEVQLKQTSSAVRTVLYTYRSPSLKEIAYQTNVFSINLNAEVLMKMCGMAKYQDPGNEAGIRAIQEFWKEKGLDITGWFMSDGSGLSPTNAIAPAQMSRALYLIGQEPQFSSFYASFPIAGQTGTVYRLGKGTLADGNIRVKSGTLTKVICYSGYFKSRSGEMYSFSLFTQNYNCSNSTIISKLEKVLVQMASLP
jgi:D-alanyl-D-alanine carboxypeptidase/D-alanyl-D-alanine-endopeptidase (penicillin-binding protein 4)